MKRLDRLTRVFCVILLAVAVTGVRGQERSTRSRRGSERGSSDFKANRLLRQAEDYLLANETERGVKMLQTLIDQYPESFVKYKAWLAMGKHYMDLQRPEEAIRALSHLKEMPKAIEPNDLKEEKLDVYLEGMYNIGVAYFDSRQYPAAFPILRKITKNFPNTVWANQAFYYIGMCHFRMENWTKCIEALELVGTSVDASDDSIRYMEAGHRFYMKIEDTDLPVAKRLGKPVRLSVKTSSGDSETVTCIALNRKGDIFIGSLPTKIGKAAANQLGDGTLQVLGGDVITTRYIDENTFKGERNIDRTTRTTVVSTGRIEFTLGTYEDHAAAAFLGQPVFAVVKDADRDRSSEADKIRIRIVSRYQEEVDDEQGAPSIVGIDIDNLLGEEEENERWIIRDEVEVELTELPEKLDDETVKEIRTGRFGGKVDLIDAIAGVEIDRNDKQLASRIGDQIVATYVDHLHILGQDPRTMTSTLMVAGKVDRRAIPEQDVIEDPKLKTEKNLVEAKALLELGRIFRDMGLMKGATQKCQEGIAKLKEILDIEAPIPPEMIERAYQLKWETEMVMGGYTAAINTCKEFNRRFPESPLVDRALKEVGMIHLEQKDYTAAAEIFRQILNLANSQIKPEAHFRLAECAEQSKDLSSAIPVYQQCSERYPDSEFAGPALAKQVEYYFDTKDYAAADELLERIFEEHPDGDFLDSMLIKWVLVAYKMGDVRKAYDKCQKLVFEHPTSPYASKAKTILNKLEPRVQAAANENAGEDE